MSRRDCCYNAPKDTSTLFIWILRKVGKSAYALDANSFTGSKTNPGPSRIQLAVSPCHYIIKPRVAVITFVFAYSFIFWLRWFSATFVILAVNLVIEIEYIKSFCVSSSTFSDALHALCKCFTWIFLLFMLGWTSSYLKLKESSPVADKRDQ